MNINKLNHIIKNGVFVDVYKINKKVYYKILYQGVKYIISEYNQKIKLEGNF